MVVKSSMNFLMDLKPKSARQRERKIERGRERERESEWKRNKEGGREVKRGYFRPKIVLYTHTNFLLDVPTLQYSSTVDTITQTTTNSTESNLKNYNFILWKLYLFIVRNSNFKKWKINRSINEVLWIFWGRFS